MAIYTVHIKGSPNEPSAIERAVFTREGFSWWALFLGPLWLIWNRAWLALLIWIVLQLGLGLLAQQRIIHIGAQSLLEFLLALAIGFEAATLRQYVLRRRGFHLVDVVQERRLVDAEQRFFSRPLVSGNTHAEHVVPTSNIPHLVGLFPSTGARR